MSPEHEERFRRILADFEQPPGGDYAELLRRGQVISPPDVDIEAWRAEIRTKARADKIRVATIRNEEVAITIRQREYKDAEVRAELRRGERMRGLGSSGARARSRAQPVAAPGRREHRVLHALHCARLRAYERRLPALSR